MDILERPHDEAWWERELLRRESDRVALVAAGSTAPGAGVLGEDPLVSAAREFAREVRRRGDSPPVVSSLHGAALRVLRHLEGAESLGYDDEVLCGQIVRCRWALAESRRCLTALRTLVERELRPEFAGVLLRCRDLVLIIDQRIRDMRERVWW